MLLCDEDYGDEIYGDKDTVKFPYLHQCTIKHDVSFKVFSVKIPKTYHSISQPSSHYILNLNNYILTQKVYRRIPDFKIIGSFIRDET